MCLRRCRRERANPPPFDRKSVHNGLPWHYSPVTELQVDEIVPSRSSALVRAHARAGGNRYGWDLDPPVSETRQAVERSPPSPIRDRPAVSLHIMATNSNFGRPTHLDPDADQDSSLGSSAHTLLRLPPPASAPLGSR